MGISSTAIIAACCGIVILCCDERVEKHGTAADRIVFPSSHEDHRGPGPAVVSCDNSMSCIPMSRCAKPWIADDRHGPAGRSKRPNSPAICGWEIKEARVCCIVPTSSSSKPPTLKTENKTQFKNGFPKNECAVSSLSNPSLDLRLETREFKITVVGGIDVTTPTKFPFVVAIFIQLDDQKIFLCGGSLISKTMVLCAAHCFENSMKSDIYVLRMGTVELNPAKGAPSEFRVTEVIVHEEFRPPVLDNDVALLKFTGLKSYSDSVRPVCLPDASIDATLKSATVVGWGSKEFGGASSQILQEVTMPVVANAECNSTYAAIATVQSALPNSITKSHLCAGDVDGTQDACQGDSGGPLVVTDGSMRWTQVGIVSVGIGCATPGIPGVYTRLSQYIRWIQSKV